MSLTKSHDVVSPFEQSLNFHVEPRRLQFRTPMWRRSVQSHLLATALAATASLLMAPCASAGAPGVDPSLEVVSAWGGPVNAAHVEGGLAYLGSGRRLVVLDVSNINNFIELAALDLGNTVQDLAVRDGYAFVAARSGANAFCVVDVSTPARPAVVWNTSSVAFFASEQPRQVQLHGDYAYVRVSSGQGGKVAVLNIADPRSPSFQGTILSFGSEVNDFAIAGDYAYVGGSSVPTPEIPGGAAYLSIFDLTANPVDPPLVGSLTLFDGAKPGDEITRLTVEGDYLYSLVAFSGDTFYTRLTVINITKPAMPTVTSDSIQFDYPPIDLATAPGRLYITNGQIGKPSDPQDWATHPGLLIYDIAKPGGTPGAPAFIKSWKTHGSIHGVVPAGNIAWLFDAGEGLIALDVTNPSAPIRRDNYHSPAYLKKMDKIGNKLYVSDLWNGFTILNVANPAAPQVLGVYQTPMTPPEFGKGNPINKGIYNWGIEIRDNRAYFAAGYGGIHVVNVANPATPNKIGGSTPPLPDGLRATAIELDGDLAHLGVHINGGGGLYQNYNITDTVGTISLPLVGSVNVDSGPFTIATRQGFSYLAMDLPLTLIDTTTPARPLNLGNMRLYSRDLAIEGDVLHVAGGLDIEGGLHLYSLAQRDSPSFDGFYPAGDSNAIAVQNQRAYVVGLVGGPGTGCLALDVANPAQPQPLAVAHSVGLQSDTTVFVDEPYVFIATANGDTAFGDIAQDKGLVILKLEGCLDSAGDADLTCDGVVNGFDLAMLLSQWTGSAFYSPCLPSLPADLSHDCRVNGADLAILLAAWG